jgi:GTPase
MDQSDPIENYQAIRYELEHYNDQLRDRPEIIVVTKSELPGAAEIVERLKSATGKPVLSISAVTGEGLPPLVHRISQVLDQAASCA